MQLAIMSSTLPNIFHGNCRRGSVQREDPNASGGEEEGRQRQEIANNNLFIYYI